MNEVDIAVHKAELAHAKTTRNIFEILTAVFGVLVLVMAILHSSESNENRAAIDKQVAEINQLKIEKNVLLQVRCAEQPDETVTEDEIETADGFTARLNK